RPRDPYRNRPRRDHRRSAGGPRTPPRAPQPTRSRAARRRGRPGPGRARRPERGRVLHGTDRRGQALQPLEGLAGPDPRPRRPRRDLRRPRCERHQRAHRAPSLRRVPRRPRRRPRTGRRAGAAQGLRGRPLPGARGPCPRRRSGAADRRRPRRHAARRAVRADRGAGDAGPGGDPHRRRAGAGAGPRGRPHRRQRPQPQDPCRRPPPRRRPAAGDPLRTAGDRGVRGRLGHRRRGLFRGRRRRRAGRRSARDRRRPRPHRRRLPGGAPPGTPRPRRSRAVTTPQPRPVRAVPDPSRPGGALRSEAGPYFGDFGGRFLPEALVPALAELTETYEKASIDPEFTAELQRLSAQYTGRPSLLSEAPRFSRLAGGARILLKREDLNHTGSHKINNVLGQALLTARMGKKRLIAETGAGQHGVATATAAALFGLECTIYMGQEDTERQALNVARMRLLGAEVIAVSQGARTLKDAINEAFRDWVANVETTHYLLGTVAGPHPFPVMVRDFQRIIGEEAREQALER